MERFTDNVGVKDIKSSVTEMIDTVIGTHFIDKKLQPSTEYSYTVKAIDAAGNVSKESTALTVKQQLRFQIQKHQHNQKDYIVWERQRQVWI